MMAKGERSRRETGRALVCLLAAAPLLAGCNSIFGITAGKPRPTCVDDQMVLIDDMEDGDQSICTLAGRTGAWYTATDGSEVTGGAELSLKVETIPNGRGESHSAQHFTGSGFTTWGAIAGLNLNVENLAPKIYDAHGFGGIEFWMKSDVPVTVKLRTVATTELTSGGTCEEHDAAANCNNHFAFALTAPTAGWTKYSVPFTALTQWPGGSATWKPAELFGIEFIVERDRSFDVWIDDVSFYYCSKESCVPTCTDPGLSKGCPIWTSPPRPAACYPPATDCQAIGSFCADPSVIDDMEDGVGDICLSDGRAGSWYAAADESGGTLNVDGQAFRPTAIPGGRGKSRYAAALIGSGFTEWGALMGFRLNPTQSYDASAAGGVRFWARSSAPFDFVVPTPATVPRDGGGLCDSDCNHHARFAVDEALPEWTEVRVPFTALLPAFYGNDDGNLVSAHTMFSAAAISSLQFDVEGYVATDPFELWIDDLSFYSCEGDACRPTCGSELPMACPAAEGRPAACWPAGTDCAHPGDQVIYNAVWGSGPGDVWAVGYSLLTYQGITHHYDGTSWRVVSGVTSPVWGVWGTGPGAAWAVADNGVVARWDGQTWANTASGTTASHNTIWGRAADDIWTISYPGTLRHWNGAAWSTSTSETTLLAGLWGSGAGDVWAVGEAAKVLHWDGAAWSKATVNRGDHYAVWGSGAGDVWVVGAAGTTDHWNGASWSFLVPVTGRDLYGVWGSGPNDVWAVGSAGTALHFDGSAWKAVNAPTKLYLTSVWGSGPADVWAVGEHGTIVHWDGTAWSLVHVTWP